MSCVRIEILNPPDYTPEHYLDDRGILILDVASDTDIRETREVGKLFKANEIKKNLSLTVNLPLTDRNAAALKQHISPNKYGRDFSPLDCRVVSGGTVLEYEQIYIEGTSDGANEIIAVLLTPEHWISKANETRLNEIDYGQMDFSNQTVRTELLFDNYKYNDGDDGHYWLLGDFGQALISDRGIGLEYIRPVLSLLYAMKEGFCHIGWDMDFEALTTDRGRRLWAYLLRENYNENPHLKDQRVFIARTSQVFTRPLFELDEVVTDPDGGWNATKQAYSLKSGESRFKISGFLSGEYAGAGGDPNAPDIIGLDVIVTINRRNLKGSNVVLTKGIYIERLSNVSSGFIEGTSDVIAHENGDEVKVHLKNDPFLVNSSIELKFEIEPVKTYYSNGDIIDWREVIEPDYTLLDLIKGTMHLFNAHYVTDWVEQKVSFYPPFDVEWSDGELEGFYQVDASAEDLNPLLVDESEVRELQERTQPRYINIGWKDSTDSYIDEEFEQPEDGAPLYGVRVDMGEAFELDEEKRLNPFFEATMNKWTSMRRDSGNPVNVPVLWDNQGGEDRSYDIGPRLLLSYLPDAHYYDKGNEYSLSSWKFLGGNENVVPHMALVPGWFTSAAGATEDEQMIYGVAADSLYNKFWKKWLQFSVNNTRLEYLLFIDKNKINDLSFRTPYVLTYHDTKMYGWIEEIRDRSECEEIATPVKFIPEISDFDCEPSIIGLSVQCRNDFIITAAKAGDCLTFDTTPIGSSPTGEEGEWRYLDASGWTNSGPDPELCSKTSEIVYRHTYNYGGGCRPVTRTRTVNPCENFPELEFYITYNSDGEHCVTVEVGGVSEKTIAAKNLFISFDGSGYESYEEGATLCGDYGEVCVSGTVEYVGACPDVELAEICVLLPPPSYPCEDNEIGVNCVEASGDCGEGFTFARTGTLVAPVAMDMIFYQCDGTGDYLFWDGDVICCDPVNIRRVVIFCDDACPTLCVEATCELGCEEFAAGTATNLSTCNEGI